jgi:type II secretory pathway component GspD/PulD (secretin)
LDTGTQLKLTPHISEGKKILLEIHPSVSEGSIDALGLPSESTTEVSTYLLAEHGDTIFLGGLIRERREQIREKIPIVGSIPLIGAFFSRTNDRVSKHEIIILITPYIISPEDEMIYAEKVDKVQKAKEIHHRKRTTVEKLFYPEKIFDKVYKTGKDGDIQIRKRRGPSSLPEKDTSSRDISKENISSAEQKMSGEKKDAGSTPHNSFSLQVGAFYEKENAVEMTENLKGKGYPTYLLVSSDKTGGPLTRVKVGPLKTREMAEEYAHRLEEEGISALISAGE